MIEYTYVCDRCKNRVDIKKEEIKEVVKCKCGEKMRRIYHAAPWHYKRVWEGSDR